MAETSATVVIKGRNELGRTVAEAERSLKGLLKQGELIGKLFRGGAIVGAFFAFERLAESAEKAAEKIGDKGTAKALRQLNKEIDGLKSKGLNLIGRVLGESYIQFAGDELQKLEVRVRSLREQIALLQRTPGGRAGFELGAMPVGQLEQQLAAAEARVAFLSKNRPYGERTRAPGSRGGGRAVQETPWLKQPKSDAMSGLGELVIWQRQLFDFSTMANQWADDFSTQVTNQIIRDVNEIANETRAMTVVVEEAEAPLSQMTVFAEQAARNMQTAFADFFYTFDGGLKGMLGSFIDTIRRMVAELAAQELLRAFFTWGAGLGGGIGNLSGTLLGGLPARAMGGPVSSGRPYIVGERGPELFVPGSSGAIIPNGGGGGSVVVNNYVTINDETDLRRAMPAILAETTRQSVESAKAAIRGDLKRYGKVR